MKRLGLVCALLVVSPEAGAQAPARAATFLDETFDDNRNGWGLRDDNLGVVTIAQGVCRATYKHDNALLSWVKVLLPVEADVRFELTFTKVAGPQNVGAGLLFGAIDASNAFAFSVTPDGHYQLGEWRAGAFTQIVAFTRHSAIRVGLGAANTLALEQQKGAWLLWINGVQVDRVMALPLKGSLHGFLLNGKSTIELDAFRIFQPKAAQQDPVPAPPVATPAPAASPAPAAPGPPPAKTIVAVFEIEDAKLKPSDREQLSDYLSARLAQKGTYSVVPREALKQSLASAKAESYKTCYDNACQIELGKALAAEAILSTKVLRIGSECAVTSSLFDLKKEITAKASSVDTGCTLKDLLAAMRKVADDL